MEMQWENKNIHSSTVSSSQLDPIAKKKKRSEMLRIDLTISYSDNFAYLPNEAYRNFQQNPVASTSSSSSTWARAHHATKFGPAAAQIRYSNRVCILAPSRSPPPPARQTNADGISEKCFCIRGLGPIIMGRVTRFIHGFLLENSVFGWATRDFFFFFYLFSHVESW